MSKVWYIKKGYKSKYYKSEAAFKTAIMKMGAGANYEVQVYELKETVKVKDIKERFDNEYKVMVREERLSGILDTADDNKSEFAIQMDIINMIENFDYDQYPNTTIKWKLNQIKKYKGDLKRVKNLILKNKKDILYRICKSVEDYEKMLRIHNFRSLPTYFINKDGKVINGKYRPASSQMISGKLIKERHPKQYEMFNQAKKNLSGKG